MKRALRSILRRFGGLARVDPVKQPAAQPKERQHMTTSKSHAAKKPVRKAGRPAGKGRPDKVKAAKKAAPKAPARAAAKHAPARAKAREHEPRKHEREERHPAKAEKAEKPSKVNHVAAPARVEKPEPKKARKAEAKAAAPAEAKKGKRGPVEEEAEGEEAEVEAEAEGDDEGEEEGADDLSERTGMKALLERGREKGFLTYEEVNEALPGDMVSADQIDDVMSMFGEHDIEVVDDASKMKLPDKPPEPEPKTEEEEQEEKEEEDPGYGKSNDPVRMYLRKMGSVSLLTREGEVEIAKRIEEGEKAVLAAVLGSSLAIKEILDLGERLRKGKIRVREIIKDAGDEPAEREGEEEEAEVEEVAEAAEGAEGEPGEPAAPKIPKEEERKVEHVLKHIDRIRKLERDKAAVRENLQTNKKITEVKRKELRLEIKAIDAEMIENLEAIQLNRKQIDRIVLRLKGLIKRVEEADKEASDVERRLGVPLREVRRLLADARVDEGAPKRIAKKLGVSA
jgi:RNA polymerase primary sigma factor